MGSPPVAGSISSVRASRICGSFFERRSAGAGMADALGGPSTQVVVAFRAAAADGIDVQAGDAGEQRIAAVPDLLGLQGGEPASLLFIEAAQEQVHVPMEGVVGVLGIRSALGTLAGVNSAICHDGSSVIDSPARESVYGMAGTNSSKPTMLSRRAPWAPSPLIRIGKSIACPRAISSRWAHGSSA